MNTLLLLDLEKTLVESFEEPWFIVPNIDKITSVIQSLDGTVAIGCMSWAFWNWTASEKLIWSSIKECLVEHNSVFDLPTFAEWSVQEWSRKILLHNKIMLDENEICQIFSKEDVLFKLRNLPDFEQFDKIILIDDVVQHDLTFNGKKCIFNILNIKEMNNVSVD